MNDDETVDATAPAVKEEPEPHSALLDALRIEFRDPSAATWRKSYQKLTRKCRCPPRTVPVRFILVPGDRAGDPATCGACFRRDKVEFRELPLQKAIPFLAKEAETWLIRRLQSKNATHEAVADLEFGSEELMKALGLYHIPGDQSTRILHRACARAILELRRHIQEDEKSTAAIAARDEEASSER